MTAWPSKKYPALNGAKTNNGSSENIRPAFELNSSTILFASAVPTATSTGNLTLQDTDGDGAFTLRYDASKYSKDLGSAVISYKETAVISMISNEEQPTTSTKSDTAVKTGDNTNILLWSMVTVISLAGVITLLFFKRRKCR